MYEWKHTERDPPPCGIFTIALNALTNGNVGSTLSAVWTVLINIFVIHHYRGLFWFHIHQGYEKWAESFLNFIISVCKSKRFALNINDLLLVCKMQQQRQKNCFSLHFCVCTSNEEMCIHCLAKINKQKQRRSNAKANLCAYDVG